MAHITIDIPEIENTNIPREEWEKIVDKAARDAVERKMKELKWKRFKKIIAKSKATEKDVEELTDEIKEAVWKRHLKNYGKSS
jgi:hypothetical protein